jgi:tetratricopeptide (TPR) repeat protein
MWYLIVPPIIIIASFGLLLWYLSRKGTDPVIAERVAGMPDGEPITLHFSRTNEIMLRLLEKFAQRSKVNSLRMHNWLHNWLQSIKANRQKVQAIKSQIEERERVGEALESSEPEAEMESFVSGETQEISSRGSFFRRRKAFFGRRREVPVSAESEPSPDTVVYEVREEIVESAPKPEEQGTPDAPRLSEEDLIGRIALNPKDFTSYEALGDFYLDQGNTKDAKECYRQVLKLRPAERSVKLKIRRLERLLERR